MIFRAIKINKTKPGGTGMASECHKGEALKRSYETLSREIK